MTHTGGIISGKAFLHVAADCVPVCFQKGLILQDTQLIAAGVLERR